MTPYESSSTPAIAPVDSAVALAHHIEPLLAMLAEDEDEVR